MSSNQNVKIDDVISTVQGPLIGSNLLSSFKSQLLAQPVFSTMFGAGSFTVDRVFIDQMPNINDTILPALILQWATDTFNSMDTYFEGSIRGLIALPAHVQGDYNSQRRVANMFQRFMGGPMQMFDPAVNPGLIKFGYGTQFQYDGLANFSGIQVPVIQMTIPFMFDLLQMQLQSPGFDFSANLDQNELPWIEEYFLKVIDGENQNVLIPEVKFDVTGQTN